MRLTRHAVTSRALNLVAAFLPDDLAARFDALFPTVAQGFGGPFNGQRRRIEAVEAMFDAISFQTVIETGTYRGTTTDFLARLTNAPIATIEAQRRYYLYARRRFRATDHVSVVFGDSAAALQQLAHESPWDRSPAFFYLDAHWLDRLPLVDELQAITAGWKDAAIVIDDFRVPEDPGYGFDTYHGRALDLDLLRTTLIPRLAVFWPRAASTGESGARRGWVVLGTPGLVDQRLQAVSLLRRDGEVMGARQRPGPGAEPMGPR